MAVMGKYGRKAVKNNGLWGKETGFILILFEGKRERVEGKPASCLLFEKGLVV